MTVCLMPVGHPCRGLPPLDDPEEIEIETETTLLLPEPRNSTNGTDNPKSRRGSHVGAPEVSTSNETNDERFQSLSETGTENNVPFNTRPLPKDAKTYELETFKKNAMVIFNNENIEGFKPRTGTAEDVTSLRETFEKFGFEIAIHNDLTKAELFEELKKFSERDFTEYGCVAVVILTHGIGNGLLRARGEGQLYSEMDIINHFKVRDKPTLISKPVMLLIQACRGKKSTRGVPVMEEYNINKDGDGDLDFYYLPVESDILIFHSSFPGKPSFRPNTGTWFIQTLCSCIKQLFNTDDFESILTEVKRQVAIDKHSLEVNRRTGETDVNKQMPVMTSTLTRKLFLRKYEDGSPRETSPPSGIAIQREEEQNRSTTGDVSPTVTSPPSGIEIQREDQNRRNQSHADRPRTHGANHSSTCIPYQFLYMKNCLRHYIRQNSNDEVAKGLFSVADLENGTNEERTKSSLNAMSEYLRERFRDNVYYDCMFLNVAGNDANNVCTCLVDQFNYMKNQLIGYIGQYPNESFARHLLDLTDYENETDTNRTEKALTLISAYLQERYKGSERSNYMYYVYVAGDDAVSPEDFYETDETDQTGETETPDFFEACVEFVKKAVNKVVSAAKYVGSKVVSAVKYVESKVVSAAKYVESKVVSAAKYVGSKVASAAKFIASFFSF